MAISFSNVGSIGGIGNPTSLQFGPDGRLYVSQQNGTITAFTVELQNGNYVATASEVLLDANGNDVVQNIQNHNDDGSNSNEGNRQVTGLVVTEDGSGNVVLYVTSSDPRIAANGEVNLDTNSGIITRVTQNQTGSWDTVDIVRGLPRSEENHSNNGLTLSADGTLLYVQVGGNTNNGAPSQFFSYTSEYALSGTLLEIDLTDINSRTVLTDADGGQGGTARDYVYDLPTLDDPSVANDGVREDANGLDVNGPFGGNDGFNQAILPSDAPLRIFADGFRNQYDVVLTQNGILYTFDNGSNGGLGGDPVTDLNGDPTDAINNGGSGDPDALFLITDGGYYGHPNPTRSNQDLEFFVYDDSGVPDTSVTPNSVTDLSSLVPASVNIQSGFIIDPSKFTGDQARLDQSGVRVEKDANPLSLATIGSSSNGLVEYTSNNFDGALQGALLVASFNGNISLLNLNDAGTALEALIDPGDDGVLGTGDDFVADADGVFPLITGLSTPLDVIEGPDGTIWVAEIGGNSIQVFAPGDTPANPDDFDNDGLLNVVDPFIRDPSNGGSVIVFPGQQYLWDFDADQDGNLPGPNGYGGGLTGVLVNGTTNFEDFFQAAPNPPRPDQDINLDNVKFITAAGGGTTVVEFASNGDPFEANNNGEFIFHTGVTIAPIAETFTVKWTVFNPGLSQTQGDGGFTGNFQQIGGYIGTGDQSNYLKIVAIQHGSGEIQVSLENNDSVTESFIQADDLFTNQPINLNKIFLELEIDPTAETATPTVSYELPGGGTSTPITGSAISLTGTNVLDAINGDFMVNGQTTGLAIGLFNTNNGQSTDDAFQAIFDDIEITATGDSTSTVLYRVNAGGPQIAAIDGGLDWAVDTTAANNSNLADPGSNNTAAFPAVDPGATVPITTPGEIFDTERWDQPGGTEMQWEFDVPVQGFYEVRLYMGNGFSGTSSPGQRVFDVAIEGNILSSLDDIDLSNNASFFGHEVGGMISNIVQVTDGTIDIDFIHGVENPLINGIEIIQLGSSSDPIVSIVSGNQTVNENDGQVQISLATNITVPAMETVDVTFEIVPNGGITPGVDYQYNSGSFDGTVYTDTVSIAGGSSDVTFLIDILQDMDVELDETFTVNITNVSANAQIGTGSATVTIQDDDVTLGAVVAAINAGGPALVQDGISFAANEGGGMDAPTMGTSNGNNFTFPSGNPFTDGDGDDATAAGPGNGIQSIFDGTVFETERFFGGDDPAVSEFSIELDPGNYTVELYFAEIFQDQIGTRVFDVSIEGQQVINDLDILAQNNGDINETIQFLAPGTYSPGANGTLDISFDPSVNNGKISAIVIREADPSGGAAEFSVTPNATDVDSSNFGANSFQITNTGNKKITQVDIDVSNALLTDAVFDPFGIAGDTIGKELSIDTAGGTGVNAPAPYVGAGGTAGFEGLQLLFDVNTNGGFEPGETVGFSVDMDPNSIAGSDKGTLDSGADPAGWDIGGVSGAELIGSTFTITFEDGTTATGQLQGNGTQGGATGQASQDISVMEPVLTVNGLTEGGVGTYNGSPTVTINGPAGQTARVVLMKGFIQPGENNFSEPFASQLDAQLNALVASNSPINNAVEFQTVDVLLDGTDQDISNLFDVSQLLNGETVGGGGFTDALVDQLPLVFATSVIDPNNSNLPTSSVSDPIFLQYTDILPADLELTKTANNSTPIIGEQITFTLTVDNNGTGDATGVQVEDILPAGYTFVSAEGDGTYDDSTGIWDVGAVANGASVSHAITVTVNEILSPRVETPLFRVNAGGTNQVATDASAPDWAVDTDGSPFPGRTGGNQFGNENGAPTFDLSLLPSGDPAPEVVFETERFGNQQWDFAVANGDYEVELYFAEIFATAAGSRVFDVSIEGNTVLDNYDIFADAASQTGGSGQNVAVVKSFDINVVDGNIDIDFTTIVDNAKISAIAINALDPGGDIVTQAYDNYAQILSSDVLDPDSTPGDDSVGDDDDVTTPVTPDNTADLELVKSVSNDTPVLGEQITFTLTVNHVSGSDTSNVTVQDILPDGFTYVSDDSSGDYDSSTGIWTIGDLANGGVATLNIDVTVNAPEVPPAEVVLYRVNAGGPQISAIDGGLDWAADTAAANNTNLINAGSNDTGAFPVSAGTTVPPTTPSNIFSTERWDNSNDAAGEMLWAFDVPDDGFYEVRLYMGNGFNGTSQPGQRVFDVEIEGSVLPNLDDVDLSDQFGHQVGGLISNVVEITDGTIDIEFIHGVENTLVNGIEIIQINDTTPVVPDYTNFAQILTSDRADPDSTPGNGAALEDDDSTVVVTPDITADLELTKTVSDSTPAFGDTVTFTLTVDHVDVSGSNASGVSVQDLLPDGFTYISDNGGGDYNPITGVWTIGDIASGASASLEITAVVNDPRPIVLAVNAGGPALVQDGINFDADTGFLNGNIFSDTGGGGANGDQTIFDGTVYETERWFDPLQFSAPLAAGDYAVDLYFAEIFANPPSGGRVFDVSIEGQQILTDFDILALNGEDINVPIVVNVPGTFDPSDFGDLNNLDITFDASVDNAKVSAIVIRDASQSVLDFDNYAQILTSDLADPDSTPGDDSVGDDDDATVMVLPTSTGQNEATILAITDAEEPNINGQFVVSLEEAASVETTINYTVAGSATGGDDYTALSGTVVIAQGTTSAPIDVLVLDDLEVEGLEDVIVTLTSATGDPSVVIGTSNNSATVNIIDNDVPNELSIINNGDASEPDVDGQFLVSLSQIATTNTIITYTVDVTSSATAGSDYTALTGTVTILAGQLTAPIDVEVIDDLELEGSEDVIVTLNGVTGDANISIGATDTATVNIGDDDVPNEVSIANNGDAAEPDVNGQFLVSLTAIAQTNTVVTYTVDDVSAGAATPGVDYTALTGTVIIPAGSLSAPIDVTVIDDSDIEGLENVTVTLTNVTGDANVSIGTTDTATVNIADDDANIGATITMSGGDTTFGNDKIQIVNTSDPGVQIINVQFDIASAVLSTGLDVNGEFLGAVWDPTGEAGDAGSQGIIINPGIGNVAGFLDQNGVPVVAPGNTTTSPYPFSNQLLGGDNGQPGGYQFMDLNFNSFDAGDTFLFGVDVDPQSIQNASGTGQAGAYSPGEMHGVTATITFEDNNGNQFTETRQLEITGLNSSFAQFDGNGPSAAPTLQVTGLTNGVRRVETLQTTHEVVVSGVNPGDTVELYLLDASGYEKHGGNGTETLPDDLFHANQLDTAPTIASEIADGTGTATFTVNLDTSTDGAVPATVDDLFFLSAGVVNASGVLTSLLSDPAEIKVISFDPVRIQAEDFDSFLRYSTQNNSNADGGQLIAHTGNIANPAFANLNIDSGTGITPGLNDITVGIFDETDGVSTLNVLLNGVQVGTIVYNSTAGTGGPTTQSFRTETISGIDIQLGDVLTLEAFRSGGEPARVDYVDFTPAGPVTPSVSIADAGVLQETGDAGNTTLLFPVTFSPALAGSTTVTYTVDNNGVITTGNTQLFTGDGSISVDVANDDIDNGTENVTVTLTAATNGILLGGTTSGTGMVTEDDIPSIVSIANAGTVQESGDVGNTTLSYAVSFDTPPSGPVTVQYSVDINGSTTTGLTQVIAAVGGIINVDVANDDLDNGTETVTVMLTGITAGDAVIDSGNDTGVGNVTEDDIPSIVSIANAGTVQESGDVGNTTLSYAVSFDTPPSGPVTVQYSVDINGSTTTGLTQVIAAVGGIINVDVANDDLDNGTETVTVMLTGITAGDAVIDSGNDTGVGSVTEDDAPIPPSVVSIGNAGSVQESGDVGNTTLSYAVSFDTPPSGPVTVQYSVDINGSTTTGLTQVIAAVGGIINVDVANDDLDNGTETVTVMLTGITAGDAVIDSGNDTGVGNVTEDDAPIPQDPVRIQAEDFDSFTRYSIQDRPAADEGQLIAHTGNIANPAFANLNIDSGTGIVAGVNDITVGIFDETDGVSTLNVLLNGVQVGTIVYDSTAGTGGPTTQSFRTETISGIDIQLGDVLTLEAFRSGGEPARVDYVEFTPTGPVTPSISIANAGTVQESGDVGNTTLSYAVSFDTPPSGPVTVQYSVDINGSTTTGLTQVIAAVGGIINVDVANDDLDNGTETVTVMLTGITAGDAVIDSGNDTGVGSVTEDDAPIPPSVVSIGNAGSVQESGDVGNTTLSYAVSFDTPPSGPVTVQYSVDINGSTTTGLTQVIAAVGGIINVDVANDDLDNGTETVTVMLTGITAGDAVIDSGNDTGVGNVTEDDAPIPQDPVRIQAEDFDSFTRYSIQDRPAADEGQLIAHTGNIANPAFANLNIDSGTGIVAGVNDITVGIFDETDGVSTLNVLLNGVQVGTIVYDSTAGTGGPTTQSFRTETISGIDIQLGDVLTLEAFRSGGEPARVDYVEFTPAAGSAMSASLAVGGTQQVQLLMEDDGAFDFSNLQTLQSSQQQMTQNNLNANQSNIINLQPVIQNSPIDPDMDESLVDPAVDNAIEMF